jgi:hypothetical protein
MSTVNNISDQELCELTSGDGNELPVQLAPALRAALVEAGYGYGETSEILGISWNTLLDKVAVDATAGPYAD